MTARILVVDDLEPNLKLLEAKLTTEYFEVVLAKSGIEALDIIAKDQHFDVILLDVMMPDLDGFETCKRLKANPFAAHIPVVMVTALSDVSDRVRGLACGADDFLTKPINDLALFARIKSLVRLKIMTDELLMRDKTALEFGVTSNIDYFNKNILSGARIVIIEDDLAEGQRIVNKLVAMGCFPDQIADPTQAITKIIGSLYDLIIVSTQLTNIDGLRLCSALKSNPEVRHIPILITIDEQEQGLIVKGLDLGVNDYIIAPVDENELEARVLTQVRRKKYQDALKDNYQKSVSLATTDSLTGMYNRHYFDSHFKTLYAQSVKEKRNLSVLIIDVDFFKKVNDTYGHLAGDEILRQVPRRVVENVRATDLIARYGGEEFVVLLPNTDLRAAFNVADRIKSSIESREFIIPHGNEEIKISKTVSIGVTTFEEGDTPDMLLDRADRALYKAKETGRNKVVWMA